MANFSPTESTALLAEPQTSTAVQVSGIPSEATLPHLAVANSSSSSAVGEPTLPASTTRETTPLASAAGDAPSVLDAQKQEDPPTWTVFPHTIPTPTLLASEPDVESGGNHDVTSEAAIPQGSDAYGKLKPWVIGCMVFLGFACGGLAGAFFPCLFCCIWYCPDRVMEKVHVFGQQDLEAMYPSHQWNANSPQSMRFEQTACTVCLENFSDGAILRALGCGHEFHVVCLDPWVIQNAADKKVSLCPVCNGPIKVEAAT